jgi:hypothetical protein
MGRPTESYSSVTGNMVLQNSAEFRVSAVHNYFNLYVPFIPVKSIGYYLLGKYEWYEGSVGFTSNNRKKLNGVIDILAGNYFNGTRQAANLSLQYRIQPWGVFSLSYRRENISLGSFGKSVFDLVGIKTDISFTTVMYFTAFLQYNTQAENVNINLRYQWRYAPMSDFFIVYSENYYPEFNSKNRTLALKLVYWFNT